MPAGRPTKYTDDLPERAFKLCLLGATDEEMAGVFGVAVSTISLWKVEHPEFSEALKKGKIEADANVAERLYQRAMGYSVECEKIFYDSKTGHVIRVPYIEHYPPETAAGIFWEKNRRRQNWRDKQDLEHSGADGAALVPVLNVSINNKPDAAS